MSSQRCDTCLVCGSEAYCYMMVKVLSKYDAKLFCCEHCGFLYLKKPTWLEEAYASPLALTDTGLMFRNINIAERLSVFLYFGLKERGRKYCIDFAGGYGILVRLMRDSGFQFLWLDKYSINAVAPGFEFDNQGEVAVVTAMEVLEHVENPIDFCSEIFEKYAAKVMIFSTCLYEGGVPDPAKWSYYSLDTGQHISFYKKKTLKKIAERLSCNYYGYGDMHVISRQPINKFWIMIAFSRFRKMFIWYVRLKMKSLLTSDHISMRNRIRSEHVIENKLI